MTNLEAVKKYVEWLDNDCGGCETCARTFSPKDYKVLEKMKKLLTDEEMEKYKSWEDAIL